MSQITIQNQVYNQLQTPALYGDILSNRPNAGYIGRIFFQTDAPYAIYRDYGTNWIQIGGGGGGGYVPYLGAIANVNLGNYNLKLTGLTSSSYITANENASSTSVNLGLLNIAATSTFFPTSIINAAGLQIRNIPITDNVTAASTTIASIVPTNQLQASTYTAINSGVTYSNAATLYISGTPIAGPNVSITNGYSLYINTGLSRLSGIITVANSAFGSVVGTAFISGSNAKIQINGAFTAGNTTTRGTQLDIATNTYTDNTTAASGTASFVVSSSIYGSIYAATNTNVTYSNAATLYINGSPFAGTNVTITNAYALYANTGNVRLGGTLTNTGIAFLNSRVNINGATDRSDFQLNITGASLTSNTVNIPAAGSISQYSINTVTDIGTTLTSGVANAANFGNIIYTSSGNRTIASSNALTGGIFSITPTISGNSTITVAQSGSNIRAITAIQAYFHVPSTAESTNTITHAAGIRVFIQADNSANNYTITNYYGLLISNSSDTVPSLITNRYGIYQEGSSDINFLNGELKLGSGQTVSASVLSTVTNKIKLVVNGTTYYLLASTSST